MSKKHKMMHKTLNHVKHIRGLSSTFSGCISVPAFALLVQIPLGITSSEIVLKICAMTAEFKKYKSIIKKRKKKHNKILLLANSKLNVIKVLMSKALIDSYIRHKEFVLINVLKKKKKKKKQQNKLKS